METAEKIKKLAHFEIEWWKDHHRKNKKGLIENMARLYSLQFRIDYEKARKAVIFRVEATAWHDKAEEHEDKGDQNQADIYWNKAEECLRKHFEILEGLK